MIVIHQFDQTQCSHCPLVMLGLLLQSQEESDGELLQTKWIVGLHSFPFWKQFLFQRSLSQGMVPKSVLREISNTAEFSDREAMIKLTNDTEQNLSVTFKTDKASNQNLSLTYLCSD